MFRAFSVFACVLALNSVAWAGDVVVLTESNYDAEVVNSGKSTFIKFYAPWCGHCKKLKPDWDKLGSEFVDSSVTIAEIDCTVDKELCSKEGVSGYPTLKYFTSASEESQTYQSGRDFESLKKFVQDTLETRCEVDNQENCDEREKKFIAKMQAKDGEAVKKELARLEKMKADSMKPELKAWLVKRVGILKQL